MGDTNYMATEGLMIPTEVEEVAEQARNGEMSNDELKEAIAKTLEKVRNDAMILGYRVACQTIVQMLIPCLQPHASRRELERIIKKTIEFAGKALKQQEDNNEETVQN